MAEEALQHMVAPELMRAALTADYTSECLQFLRSFDQDDPDPATVIEFVRNFEQRMTSLFVHGFIMSKLPCSQSTVHGSQKTACQLIFDEIQDPEPRLGYMIRFSPPWALAGSCF